MSYHGYEYNPYQYSASRQDYSSLRHVPTPPNSSADTHQQQQSTRDYGFGSSGSAQDANSQVHIPQMGEPPSRSSQQGYGYRPQTQEPGYRSAGSTINNSFGAGIDSMRPVPSNDFSNTSQQRTDAQISFQSNQFPMDVIDRPLSTGSRSRDAASAMTALSTSVPARKNSQHYIGSSTSASQSINQVPSYSQLSTNTMYPALNTNPSGPVSRTSSVTPQNNSPQMRAATHANTYRTMSGLNTSHQLQRTYSPVMTSAPSPPIMYADRQASSYTATAQEQQQQQPNSHVPSAVSNTSIMAESNRPGVHDPPSLPGFIDPTQIYNPYHLEYERNKSEKAAAEAQRQEEAEAENRRKDLEAEEARQRREAEAEMKRQAAAEARRKKAEAELQQGTANEGATLTSTSKKPAGQKRQRKSMPAKTSTNKGQYQPSTQDDINARRGSRAGGDMWAEMKRMMTQLQQFKTSNPALFKQLLQDIGDDQASASSNSQRVGPDAQYTASQDVPASETFDFPIDPAIQSMAPDEPQITDTDSTFDRGKFPAARRKHRRSKPFKADEISASQLNAIDSDSTLPDRGKFPAARRRRVLQNPKGHTGTDSELTNNPALSSWRSVEYPAGPITQAVNGQTPAPQAATSSNTELQNSEVAPSSDAQPTPEPKPKPTQGTIWPAEKRSALAQAASSYISSVEANKGKDCSADIILAIIDQNPSYVVLCDLIEARGLVINKVHFARHLLKAVPDLSSSSAAASPAPGPPPPKGSPSVTAPGPAQSTSTLTPTPQPHAPTATPTANPPTPSQLGTPGPPAQPSIPLDQTIPGIPSTTAPAQPYPPPLAFPGQSFQPSNHISGFIEAPPSLVSAPQAKPAVNGAGSGSKLNPKLRVPAPPSHVPAPGSKEALARKRTFAEIVDLAQLSDDDEEEPASKELRVEEAPTDGPMNGVAMSQNVPAPQTPADAGTGTGAVTGASPPNTEGYFIQFKLKDGNLISQNEEMRSRSDLIKPLNKDEALRKSYYDPKTIARDILIAAGRHPTERPLNHHLAKLRDKFSGVDNSADLRTFRWDIVDPGGPPRPEVPLAPVVCLPPKFPIGKRQGLLPKSSRDPTDNTPRPLTSTSSDPQSQSQSQPSPQQAQHSPSHLRTVSNATDQSPRAAPAVAVGGMSQTPSSATPGAPRRRPGRPPGAKNKNTTAKTPGRNVQVAIPGGGRSSDSYRVFRCQWEGCGAELHNLKTLKRHVNRVHVQPQEGGGMIPCLWSGCGSGDKEEEGVRRQMFLADGLRRHLESTHLSAVAWKMGEGPALATGSDQVKHTSFLQDTQNRTVTPRATTDGNPPTLILPAAYRSIQSFNKIHGHDSDRAKAMQVMRALEAKQVNIGTGLSRGGCTLMNAKRQETVAGDEGVFEIVDVEDDVEGSDDENGDVMA